MAGAGKTAAAQSIAQRCSQEHILLSSFFFDRTSGRDTPKDLLSTIAFDLSKVDVRFAEAIAAAIETERGIATVRIGRRPFEKLILEPSLSFSIDRRLVIVIDALDEGFDSRLLEILRDHVPRLPSNFRIFVTSRKDANIASELLDRPHIRWDEICLDEDNNRCDLAVYVKHRLLEVATKQDFDQSWPGTMLMEKLIAKAEGLFLWAVTVCDYLSTLFDPFQELETLALSQRHSGSHADLKMDNLYATILGKCNWNEKAFADGFALVMGSIIAAKSPLSVAALQFFIGPKYLIDKILRPLRSLLTSLDDGKPVRICHESLRDFLTLRCKLSSDHQQYCLSEREHSRRLANMCLTVLNEDWHQGIPGMGYLSQGEASNLPGIPKIAESVISEQLWYACRFWMDHIIEVEPSDNKTVVLFWRFIGTCQVINWMEVVAGIGQFQSMARVQEWINVGYYAMSCL